MSTNNTPIGKNLNHRYLIYLILVGSCLITIAISPWNYDPVSVPKMTLLALLASASLSLQLLTPSKQNGLNSFDWTLLIFTGLLLLNVVVNNYAISERLFGVSGRNTGFFTYTSFVAIAFVMSRNYRSVDAEKVFMALFVCNLMVMGYYLTQRAGIDVISITNYYSRPSSTLGNPNYVSGFLGFTSLAPFLLYQIRKKRIFLLFSLFTIPVNIFVIWDSQSIQGIFSLAFSIFIFLGVLLSTYKLVFGIYISSSFFAAVLACMGFLGNGPLSHILNTTTLVSRFDYWRAASNMTFSNPIFGIGLDGYGDHYRMYRDEAAFNRFGESLTSDTPHNVLLDFFASGGLPLGICFIFLVAIVYLNSAKLLFESAGVDLRVLGLFTILNGYLIQSLVSPNQIGVGVWLWVLLGALMGARAKKPHKSSKVLENLSGFKAIRTISRLTIVTLFLILVPILFGAQARDKDFLSAARSTDGAKILENVESWPYDSKRYLLAQAAFSASQLHQYSLRVARLGVSHNPKSYLLWQSIYQNPITPAELKLRAFVELNRLEPRYDHISSSG